MFQSRLTPLVPTWGFPPVIPSLMAPGVNNPMANTLTTTVQTSDIYQAAKNRAIEDHELDKLFNPEYYDYQI